MDKKALLSAKWLERYGSKPPEWVHHLEDLEDDHKATFACQKRILDLSLRLQQERALLHLLQSFNRSGPDFQTFQEAAKTPPCEYSSEKDVLTFERHESTFNDNSTNSLSRRRALQHVDRHHERLARRVKERVKDYTKHWSVAEIGTIFNLEEEEEEEKEQTQSLIPPSEEEGTEVIEKSLIRTRSRSESSICHQSDKGVYQSTNTSTFKSRLPSANLQFVTQVKFNPLVTDNSMAIPGKETKRLSNGSAVYTHLSDDEENEIVSSVKTIVGDDILPLKVSLIPDVDPTNTLRRDTFFLESTHSSGSGEKTPTDALMETFMVDETAPPSGDLDLCLAEAGHIYHHEQEQSFDDDEFEDEYEKQSEDVESINEMESSGYHSNFQNLAESTLTYILRDTIFASRSNSMSSLNDSRRSLSPDPTTPHGGVSLRPNSGRIKERNRAAHVLENQLTDDCIDEERLHKMLLEIQDSSPYQSPSSVSSYSDPSSPTHLVPYDHMTIHQVS